MMHVHHCACFTSGHSVRVLFTHPHILPLPGREGCRKEERDA
jgi:hypothetical protein